MTVETDGAVLEVAGAAQFMGTTEKAIRQRVARHLLPFRKLGGRVIFLRAELEAFLQDLPGCRLEEAQRNIGGRDA
jgi:hypothetical protein